MDGITAKMQAYERALDTAQAEIATLKAQLKAAKPQLDLQEAAFYETRMWRGWYDSEFVRNAKHFEPVWSNSAPCRAVLESVRATDDAAMKWDSEYGFPWHAVVTMLLDALEACRKNDATKYEYRQPRHLDQKPPKQGGRWATPFEIASDAISEYREMVAGKKPSNELKVEVDKS